MYVNPVPVGTTARRVHSIGLSDEVRGATKSPIFVVVFDSAMRISMGSKEENAFFDSFTTDLYMIVI